jgi:RNA polymerase sigma-70 factor (ECF subfamily)
MVKARFQAASIPPLLRMRITFFDECRGVSFGCDDETILIVMSISDRQKDLGLELTRVLQTHGQALRRLCAAYRQEPSDRQDLFQEIAMALWTALPRFRGAGSERTWLYRIAHNVALTYSAKRRRRLRLEEPIDDPICDPITQVDLRRLALLESLQHLNPVDRQLMLLYLEGLSTREIQEVTGLTANNVGVRLTHCVANWRQP